jgi:hypothetical protein
MKSNKSLLQTPLTPLAIARGVKGSLAALGAAEFNRYAGINLAINSENETK